MDMLTYRDPENGFIYVEKGKTGAAQDLLHAYELTNLTPAEIAAMQAENQRLTEEYEAFRGAAEASFSEVIRLNKELAAYRQAEQEGRMVRVPKIGDTVYRARAGEVESGKAYKIEILPSGTLVHIESRVSVNTVFYGGYWMRDTFSTEEAARAALDK